MEVEASIQFSISLIGMIIYFIGMVIFWRTDKLRIVDGLFKIHPKNTEGDTYELRWLAIELLMTTVIPLVAAIISGYSIAIVAILTIFSSINHIPTTCLFALSGIVLLIYVFVVHINNTKEIMVRCYKLRDEIIDRTNQELSHFYDYF